VSADTGTWVFAVLQVGTAIGIVVFWVSWLRTEHDPASYPAGFLDHERAFVLPDSVLAAVLTAAAVLELAGSPLGSGLALIATGMLLFLGLIDAAYFARHGMFARERGGVGNTAIVVWMLLLAALLGTRHL
jgi:hypothetical protein